MFNHGAVSVVAHLQNYLMQMFGVGVLDWDYIEIKHEPLAVNPFHIQPCRDSGDVEIIAPAELAMQTGGRTFSVRLGASQDTRTIVWHSSVEYDSKTLDLKPD